MYFAIVVVVDMRRREVQRSEARGRGVERWHHRFGKYADSTSTWEQVGCVFGFFYPETRFQKSAFSGSVWTVGQNDVIHVRFRKRAFSCGRPLNLSVVCRFRMPTFIFWALPLVTTGGAKSTRTKIVTITTLTPWDKVPPPSLKGPFSVSSVCAWGNRFPYHTL